MIDSDSKSIFDRWLEAHLSEAPKGQSLDGLTRGMLVIAAIGGFFWRPLWLIIPLLLAFEILFKLSWIMVYLYAIVGFLMGKSNFYTLGKPKRNLTEDEHNDLSP